MDANIVKFLVSSPIFHDISASELEIMLDCLKPRIQHYKKNSYIAVEGETYTGLGILLSGEASVAKENASGSRIIMTMIGPGDLFGEMIAFSTKEHWPASVFAQTTCSVMFLSPEKIIGGCSNECANYKQLIKNMLAILSAKALFLNQRVEYLAIKGMRGKISTYLLEQYKINNKNTFILPLKRNELADFLSVSRTALSRELGRMRDEGIIEFYRTSVKINNLVMLREGVE